jgi:ABC-type nitrate/sulfonate/bicarbonate transport system ATPase subunit
VAERLGNEVIEFKDVSKSFGDRVLIDKLSFKVPAGAIVGIIGPNGAGKSTLFRMLQGVEKPDSGEVLIGKTAHLAFVDQSRESLANDKTVWEDVSGGLDNIVVGKFVMPSRAYLGRFNFKGNDQQKLVGNLSGGERGRLHLAKTLAKGGNVLMLDEPSNDLDVETLRALEEALLEFAGRPWSSATTAGSSTASAPTSSPARATRSGSSTPATTRSTRPTRRSAWARRAHGRSACASSRSTDRLAGAAGVASRRATWCRPFFVSRATRPGPEGGADPSFRHRKPSFVHIGGRGLPGGRCSGTAFAPQSSVSRLALIRCPAISFFASRATHHA